MHTRTVTSLDELLMLAEGRGPQGGGMMSNRSPRSQPPCSRPTGARPATARATRVPLVVTILAAAMVLTSCATPPPVDSTPPTIVSHTPADGSDNVSVHQAIEVHFSEPIAAATVTDATVQLAGTGSVNLAKTLSLSDDGVMVVNPVASLTLPQDVVLNLSGGVQDGAGNPLAPYAYGWTVPSWLRLGEDPVLEYTATTFIYSALLAADSQGVPVVANNRETSPPARLRRWDGEQWQTVPLPPAAEDSIFIVDLAFDQQDRLVLVWEGRLQVGEHSDFHVSRLDGATWTLLGTGLRKNANYYPSAAALAIRSDGQPVIAWAEKTTPGNSDTDQYVSRWDGATWLPVGGKLDVVDTNSVLEIDLAIGLSGGPLVSWKDSYSDVSHVRTFDSTTVSWQSLGTVPVSSSTPRLLVPGAGGLVAAVRTASGIRLYRFDGANWLPLGAPLLRQVGASPGQPSLQLSQSDTVMVAWTELLNYTYQVNVAELTEGGWLLHGAALTIPEGSSFTAPSLALLEDDVPALAVSTYEPVTGSTQFVSRTLYRQLNR